MLDFVTYTTSRERLGSPIYTEERSPQFDTVGPFYDEEGRETVGSRIGRYLSFAIMIGFIFYLWAR